MSFPYIAMKGFNLSDIEWTDARHITIRGVILVSKKGDASDDVYFSWTREAERWSDGADSVWEVKDPVFGHSTLTKEQFANTPRFYIVDRGEAQDSVK